MAFVDIVGGNRTQVFITGVLVDTVIFHLPPDFIVKLTDLVFNGTLAHKGFSSFIGSVSSLASPRAAQSRRSAAR